MNRPINFESLVINQLEIQTRFHLNIIYLIDIYFYFQLSVFKTIMVITIPACTLLPDIYIYIYIYFKEELFTISEEMGPQKGGRD